MRLAELWVVNRDLKASDFSSISWMVLLVEDFVDGAVSLEEPEGPAATGKQGKRKMDIRRGQGEVN